MKKILILALLSALLLTACSFSSNDHVVNGLSVGMKKADVFLKIGAGNYVHAEQYAFFKDADGRSVVLYFDKNDQLSRIEAYETPENEPTLSVRSDLAIGTSIYEAIRYLGVPDAFSHGGHYQLTFDYPNSRVITTWEKTDTDNMLLVFKPYFIDYTETTAAA